MGMTICPFQREALRIGWQRSLRVCSVPETIGKHKESPGYQKALFGVAVCCNHATYGKL